MPRFIGLGTGQTGALNLSTYTPLIYACSGSSASHTLTATGTFSPGDRLAIYQARGTDVGMYEDNRVVSYTTGSVTLLYPLERDYSSTGANKAWVQVVPEATTITGTLTVPAWNGTVGGGIFLSAIHGFQSITINGNGGPGTESPVGGTGGGGTGGGYRGGDGRSNAPQTANAWSGEGTAGPSVSQNTPNGNGGGAGRVTNFTNSPGGGGGYATAGSISVGTPSSGQVFGQGGLAVGQADLATGIFMGGGGGGSVQDAPTTTCSGGGSGGGFIVLYGSRLFGTGSLTVNGGLGYNRPGAGSGGGGGAGGTILARLLRGDTAGYTITANKGLGGVGGGQPGGDASDGRIRIEACSGAITTTPEASIARGGHSYCGSSVAIL